MSEDSALMDVDIAESKAEVLRDKLGDVITDHLLQKPNEALIAELLSVKDANV